MKLKPLAAIELAEKFTELAIQNSLISEQSSAEKKAKDVAQFYFTEICQKAHYFSGGMNGKVLLISA